MKQQNSTYPLNHYYSKIYRKYDLINRIFTFGNDQKWRRYTAKECRKNNPKHIIDICCGTGDLCISLSRKIDYDANITGFDLNVQMLEMAEIKTKDRQIKNIEYVQGDVAEMPFEGASFDAMTIGFGFRNLIFENPNAKTHLKEIHRILKKNAALYILESSVPTNKFIRFCYTIYLKFILIPLGSLISGNREAYSYLANSSANFFDVEEVAEILMDNGFKLQSVKIFFLGASNLITAIKE